MFSFDYNAFLDFFLPSGILKGSNACRAASAMGSLPDPTQVPVAPRTAAWQDPMP